MKAFLLRFLIILFIVHPLMSYSQEKETPEETLINDKIDSLLNRAVLAVSDLEYDKAIDLLKYSRQLAIRVDHPKRVALTTGTLATLYYQIDDYETAELENKKAIKVQQTSDSPKLLGQSYITAAKLSLTRDNEKEALTNLEKAENSLKNQERPDLVSQLYTLRGDILQKQNNKQKQLLHIIKLLSKPKKLVIPT